MLKVWSVAIWNSTVPWWVPTYFWDGVRGWIVLIWPFGHIFVLIFVFGRWFCEGLSRVQSNSCPADVLVDAWDRAKPAAFDVTVTSPLTPASLHDACNSAGVAAHKAECRKHSSNDPKCQELGWVCVPFAVESYGNWGKEAQNTFARLSSILSISLHCPKAKVLTEIYGRLNISLVRSVARAILSRRCRVPG